MFRGVEVDLAPGDVLCVLGPNGSGKSTLLKVFAGLLDPSEGSVEGPGRVGLGYAALDLALYPHLTAREHLALAATLRGLPSGPGQRAEEPPEPRRLGHHGLEAHATVEALATAGLATAADRLVGQFSSGMRARLKLALAVQASPPLLMLDEPRVALDEGGRGFLDALIDAQRARGAVVIATNDPEDRRNATHELVLDA